MNNKKNLQSIVNNITEVLVKSGVLRKKINKNYNFVQSKDLDSLSIFSFISEVEKKFLIKFKTKDLLKKNFQSVDGLSKIIKKLI